MGTGSGAGESGSAGSADGGGTGNGTGGDATGGGSSDGPHDGSRIQLVWSQSAHAPKTLVGLRDTKLGVACSFQTAADGRLRCLPGRFATGSAWRTNAWVPYVEAAKGCSPAYVLQPQESSAFSCDAGPQVYAVGDVVQDVCTAISVPDDTCITTRSIAVDHPDGGFYLAGDLVPPESFVAADATVGDATTRITRRFLDGEDGSRVPYDLYDTELDQPCSWRSAADGTLRCLPVAGPDGFAYVGNPPVATPYLEGNMQCAPTAVDWPGDTSPYACGDPTVAINGVGDPVQEICTGLTNGTCTIHTSVASDAPAGAAFFVAAGAMDPTMFAAGTSGLADDGTRIRRQTVVTDDGFESDVGLYDDSLQVPCAYVRTSDGSNRCLPTTYADSAELVPGGDSVPVMRGNTNCPPVAIVKPANGAATSCDDAVAHAFQVDGHVTMVCSATSGQSCIGWTSPASDAPAGAVFYVAGAEIPPKAFVADGQ